MTLFVMDVVQCVQYKNYKSVCKGLIPSCPGGRLVTTMGTDSAATGISTHCRDGFRRVSTGMYTQEGTQEIS